MSCLLTVTLHIVDVRLTCLINITYLLTKFGTIGHHWNWNVLGPRHSSLPSCNPLAALYCCSLLLHVLDELFVFFSDMKGLP